MKGNIIKKSVFTLLLLVTLIGYTSISSVYAFRWEFCSETEDHYAIAVFGGTCTAACDSAYGTACTAAFHSYDGCDIEVQSYCDEPAADNHCWCLIQNTAPSAKAGTSLDGNNMLQLDGTLSSDPESNPLTFSWQIEEEPTPRTGMMVSIADLPVGNYKVILTVSDSTYTDTDIMLFGVPAGVGVPQPPVDALQEQVQNIKDQITSFSTSSFDAPNDKAVENRRKALLNMLDKVSGHIGAEDFQAAIDQLRDILAKSDGLEPPNSAPDWILGSDMQVIFQDVSDLIANLL